MEMPIDLEMLLSASSPIFYPYSFETAAYSDSIHNHNLSFAENRCVPRSFSKHRNSFQGKFDRESFGNTSSYSTKNITHPEEIYCVHKKKVSFADDKGLKLVEVCEIPGVPKWADDVITLLIGSRKRSVIKEKRWKVAFEHPPWPDEKLANTLEMNCVALEHVAVKEATEDFLLGTIKVKNLAFEKEIFLRVSFDRWLSYIDVPCSYMKPIQKFSSLNAYDTFYFSTKISPVASRYEVIEFCVCFKCNGEEYWDNCGGINYRLTVDYTKSAEPHIS